jgi:hypothetical protein
MNLTASGIKGPFERAQTVIQEVISSRKEQIRLSGPASARKGKYELDFLDRLLETFNEDGSLVRFSFFFFFGLVWIFS